MATKVKPTRLNISGTIQQGQVPIYVNDDCFGVGTIPTDNCELANGCGYLQSCDLACYAQCCDMPNMSCYQQVCNLVCDLTGADNTHYPSAKAVADAIGSMGGGDMLKSVYDPNNHSADAFDYCNFTNTPTIPTDNCQLANGCGYTTCTGTLVPSDIKTINGCCLIGSGDVCIQGGVTSVNGCTGAVCLSIPTDNCELSNGCGYTTCTGTLSTCSDITTALGYTPYSSANPCGYTSCTGTLQACDIANLAQCCDIPTDNCQLSNGCGYTTCTGTLNGGDLKTVNGNCLVGSGDICIQGGVTSVNGCTGDVCLTIPTDNCQLGNGCGYTTCTGTVTSADLACYAQCCDIPSVSGFVQESCIACVNGCCLTNGGDITISGGTDYSWCTQTISGGNVTLCLRTIVNNPTSNFTLVKPDTLQEGEEYVIRTISKTSYCMCLGACFTNPRNVNTCLSSMATDQYVFLAIGGELELQPLVATGS